jgi:hypothetical protein
MATFVVDARFQSASVTGRSVSKLTKEVKLIDRGITDPCRIDCTGLK